MLRRVSISRTKHLNRENIGCKKRELLKSENRDLRNKKGIRSSPNYRILGVARGIPRFTVDLKNIFWENISKKIFWKYFEFFLQNMQINKYYYVRIL